jgi:hypothetical protein
MNSPLPDRWSALADGYLLGTLSKTDSIELEQILAQNPTARADFRRRCNVDTALRSEAASQSIQTTPITTPKRRIRWRLPLRWAAAILILGLFGRPLVWAFTAPRLVATASRVSSLHDSSFEQHTGRLGSGFPSRYGEWSGDPAESVTATGVHPKNGTQVLRLIAPFSEQSADPARARSCDVFQLVDLRPLRSTLASGDAFLELSADFLDNRSALGNEIHFLSKICLFSGDPLRIHKTWPACISEALTSSAHFEFTRGQSPGWKKVSTKVIFPPQADFAVIHLGAGCQPERQKGPIELGAQFLDNVTLTLKTQPTLPVRTLSN